MVDADSLDVVDMSELDFERRIPGRDGCNDADASSCPCVSDI